ncbi:hypothetical protein NIES593_02820 [Hydrococcus rivularis NIES-593]|uniref:Tic22 family protein n=1 Tax=Hydrococcus rivularis NIES-593 TaxID=1921803 RepID=A0A1U7HR32_9CYAN|nr:Tic22 family protein [Hydrococcus rivularis]OKH26027.1 hypothetical protein NIES593_02820 [Hydrococcus rivularis NIES-593]
MKSLIRWSATLGLVGSAILGVGFGQAAKVLALPQDQIVKTLQPVPVFTIVDAQGAPIVRQHENKQVTGVFISQQDAQKFFQQLQQQNPELAKKVKVQPVSLGEVYKFSQSMEGKPDGLNIDYVPMNDEVELAKQVMNQNGQQYPEGVVPLFVARVGKEQGYLMIERNNESRIPFFFEKAQLQQLLERFKKEKPDLASTVKIEVIPLEIMIATMKEKNDEMLTKIELVPSQESLQFIQSTIQNRGQSNPQGQSAPQNQPAQSNPQNQQKK